MFAYLHEAAWSIDIPEKCGLMVTALQKSTEPEGLAERIRDAGSRLGLRLPADAHQQLAAFAEALLKWNKTYNLTALRTLDQILVQHIFDSMAAVPSVTAFLTRQKSHGIGILDVGSGAGLPGVVFATLLTDLPVTCVDAVQKKVAFINYAAGQLACENLKAIHERIEELPPAGARLVVSRAFASLIDFTRLAGKHACSGGRLLAMKSRRVDDDIAAFLASTDHEWLIESVEAIEVPSLDAKRYLVWLKRNKDNE